ncbi:MAG: hypothetical protein JWQ16_1730 [Novosphingobium sp.]|nr:hypothetical protein [Novosphingobium sp.]
MTPEGRSFEVRLAPPPTAVLDLAKTLHEAHQRWIIHQHGRGEYALWSHVHPTTQAQWCAIADAALAHLASAPAFPLDAHMPGGICG